MNARLPMCRYSTWRQIAQKKDLIAMSAKNKAMQIVGRWEDFFGLTAVRVAQDEVLQCEKKLGEAQKQRRLKQNDLKALQMRLKDFHAELDRTSRGDDRFLHLLTEEHAAIKKERKLLEEFEEAEAVEREMFQLLSARVRSSHEKERERVEKNKYISLWATVTGAIFGVIGTTLAAELRMRRLKELIPTAAQVTPVLEQVRELVDKQHSQVISFISDLRGMMDVHQQHTVEAPARQPSCSVLDDASLEKLVASMKEQNAILTNEMDELKRLLAVDRCRDIDVSDVVYVGSDMQLLLQQTQKNLESRMKLQTLLSVVFLYGAAVITVPLVLAFLRTT